MGKNLFEKIIGEHLVSGEMKAGQEIEIRVEQTLTQDALGTMAYLQYETLGGKVATDSIAYIDHNMLYEGHENPDDHRYMQTIANNIGVKYSKAGNGICHQVHLERFSRPGQVLIGGDSHTPTCGGVAMLAMGAGGLDVAAAMKTGRYFMAYPKVIRVNLEGKLSPWVTAKDIILEMLKIFTTKGNVGCVIEYGGTGISQLSVPERGTIANMGAEMGVTTSMFPSDEVTKTFFAAQDRLADWKPYQPDEDAEYDRIVTLDLSTIVPNVACPHSPDQVKAVKELEGMAVDQVLIGSCTNSSYRDMMLVAHMLKGRKVNPNVSVGIVPGSRQVQEMIVENGLMEIFLKAGVRMLESGCSFCCGSGQSPQSKGVSLRTNNRNFLGRSGTKDGQVYLVSPASAAAAALTGKITDPREAGITWPDLVLPEQYTIDDGLIVWPGEEVEIFRGPSIHGPSKLPPMPKELKARAAIKVGDKITTDHITRSGALLKYRSNIPKYCDYVFCDVKESFASECRENKNEGYASVIVAGQSYGQGSSREHAAMCPAELGVKIVLAKSVERIHAANLINFGILEINFIHDEDYDRIEDGDELYIADVYEGMEKGRILVENVTKGYTFETSCHLTPRQQKAIRCGGMLNSLTE